MISNGRNGATSEWLKELATMETEELDALDAMFKKASEENARKDAARYAMRACDKTLADFEKQGFSGVLITRDVEGNLVVEGVPREIPRFLKETA